MSNPTPLTPEQNAVFDAHDARLEAEAQACDKQENQDALYQDMSRPMPPNQGDIVELDKSKKIELRITDVKDPMQALAFMHPEFAQAIHAAGGDLSRPAGRELEQMRKFFAHGSGTYLVTVDFQIARTEAFKLDEKAQKRITRALNEKPAKRKKSTRSKKVKK